VLPIGFHHAVSCIILRQKRCNMPRDDAQHRALLRDTTWHRAVQWDTTRHRAVLQDATRHRAVLWDATQHRAVLQDATRHRAVLWDATRHCAVLRDATRHHAQCDLSTLPTYSVHMITPVPCNASQPLSQCEWALTGNQIFTWK